MHKINFIEKFQIVNVMGNICHTCLEELETAYTFKLKCDKLNYENRDTAPKQALCEICGKTFKNIKSLKQHRDVCRKCKSTDQTHDKSHTKKCETPKHKSNIGGDGSLKFRFTTNKWEVTQMKRSPKVDNALQDLKLKTNEFVCPYCEFKFLTAGGLHSHIMWHKIRKRKFRCSECKLVFLNDVDLRKHEKYEH